MLTLSRNVCVICMEILSIHVLLCVSPRHKHMKCVRHESEAEESFTLCNCSDIIRVFITHFLTPQYISAIGGFRTNILSRRQVKPILGHCLLLASKGCSCTSKSHLLPSSSPPSPPPPSSPFPTSATVGLQTRYSSTSKMESQKRSNFLSILLLILYSLS